MRFARKTLGLLFVSLFLFVFGCVGQPSKTLQAGAGKIEGEKLFTLEDLKGSPVNLTALLKEKKAVLLNFWATWCPPCREEIPDLIRLQQKFQGQSFTILGVNVGESQKKVSSFVEKVAINYPVVLDADNRVSSAYHIVGIPTSLLVAADGSMLGEYHAATPELFEDVEKAIG